MYVGKGKLVVADVEEGLVQALIQIDGKWFLGNMINPKAQNSMLAALNQAMRGGMTINDMSYMLPNMGITLADCAKDDLAATLEFISQKCENELNHMAHYGHAYRQTIDHLQKFRDEASDCPELQKVLVDAIQEMSKLPIQD